MGVTLAKARVSILISGCPRKTDQLLYRILHRLVMIDRQMHPADGCVLKGLSKINGS